MGRISALTELTSLASDDYLVVLDSSANIAKKISIANAFGIPEFGFTATGESWTYSAYSSTTRIAEITVPTDATTKYVKGMRVKFTQPTDGVKWGIIHKVEATKLHVFMKSGNDFDNEAITSPLYSSEFAPTGFDLDPTLWLREVTNTTQINMGSIASAATITNFTGMSLALGVGDWDLGFEACGQITHAGVAYLSQLMGLSTANNTFSDVELVAQGSVVNTSLTQADSPFYRNKRVHLTSATTYYLNTKSTINNTTQYLNGTLSKNTVRAYSAYI